MSDQSNVHGVTVTVPLGLLSCSFVYKISRLINHHLGRFFRISISRYSSTISIYSSSDDLQLYSSSANEYNFSGLNIGSGFFSHPSWECVDLPAQSSIYKSVQGRRGVDFIALDLNQQSLRSHFGARSFDAIYSSHTLEHLSRTKHQDLFYDVHYILKKSGVFRVCIPDILSLFYAAVGSLPPFAEYATLFFIREAYTPLYYELSKMTDLKRAKCISDIHRRICNMSPTDVFDWFVNLSDTLSDVNALYPPDYHISYPTAAYLEELAKMAGFSLSFSTSRGISTLPAFSNKFLFDTTIPNLSLYMEFIK